MILLLSFPIELQLGTFKLNIHLLTELLAFFVGFRYYLYQKRKFDDPISSTNRLWVFIGATAGAFLGSRLLGSLEQPKVFFSADTDWLYYYGNKTIVGGLLGGLIGVELIKKWIKEKRSSGDLMVFPIILGMIIGRIGCFSMGVHEETYGVETSFFMGMNLGDGLLRHPVSLYEILFLGCLWIVLALYHQRKILKEGLLFQFFMMAYLVFRFSLDFIKPGDQHLLNLTSIQWACLAGLVYYRKTLLLLFTSPSNLIIHEH